jgi:hypothetical protein
VDREIRNKNEHRAEDCCSNAELKSLFAEVKIEEKD